MDQLVQTTKDKCQELKLEDVVFIKQEICKCVMWPMGKIMKIYSSRDGATRLGTSSRYLKQPIQKLYPLEVLTAEDHILQ